jgi:signal peptidase I
MIQAFFIPSASMFPTLGIDERVQVKKLSYYLHEVNRGDLVVFERPESEADFVMGDNREEDSRDSRFFGPLDQDLIIGRAFVKVWPLNDLGLPLEDRV